MDTSHLHRMIERGIVVFAIIVALAASTLAAAPSNLLPPPPKPGATYWQLSTASAGESLFGLTYVGQVIDSAYSYEANLLDYSAPVADIDYILPYAAQERFHLPGFTTDRYQFAGSIDIPGSGIASKWIAPNGGHFAFLHLGSLWTSGTPSLPRPHASAQTTPEDTIHGGDKNTILAMRLTSWAPTGQIYTGGSTVGTSMWPTDPAYGNGTSGASNAHLCFLLDATAADWFYAIVTGQHKPPAPKPTFPVVRWERYRASHHWGAIRYSANGHLMRIPWVWWTYHAGYIDYTCGGVYDSQAWNDKSHFMRQSFGLGCVAYMWPDAKGQPVKVVDRNGKTL